MSLADWLVPIRELVRETRRIADALDIIVLREYDWRMRPPKADTRGEAPDVSYASDEESLRHELEDLARGTPLADEPEPQPVDGG